MLAFSGGLMLLASCPVRGASRGHSEVGQSESLAGAGNPKPVGCGARGCGLHPRTREALGFRPGPLRGPATSVAGRGQAAARNRRSATSPEERTRVLRRRGGTLKGVAVCLCFPAIRETSRGLL